MTDLQVKLRLYCCYATNEQQNGVQMQRGVKLALGVVVLVGLAFAQWKYGAGQQLLNLVHPQQQTLWAQMQAQPIKRLRPQAPNAPPSPSL